MFVDETDYGDNNLRQNKLEEENKVEELIELDQNVYNNSKYKEKKFNISEFITEEKFEKLKYCQLVKLILDFNESIDKNLPKYIIFNNNFNCRFNYFIHKINIYLDKSIHFIKMKKNSHF